MKNINKFLTIMVISVFGFNAFMNAESNKKLEIEKYFLSMPDEILPAVDDNTKKDLIDFYTNNKEANMPNIFGSKIILSDLSNDYLMLKTSTVSDLQMKILALNDTTKILALIKSISVPYSDSYIRFYSLGWKQLKNIPFREFTVRDFIDEEKCGKKIADEFVASSRRSFIKIKFSSEGNSYLVTCDANKELPEDVFKKYKKYFSNKLIVTF